MSRIANDLIEAYKGFYEDQEHPFKTYRIVGEMSDEQAAEVIQKHSPKERLEVYLTWNSIIGYTDRIWEISQGEINV